MRSLVNTRLGLALLALAVVVGACGSDADESTAESTTAVDTEQAADDQAGNSDDTEGDDTEGNDTETDVDAGVEAETEDAAATDEPTPDAAESTDTAVGQGLDAELFVDGALAGDPVAAPCTLSDGSTSECYTVTVTGTPANHDVGPFCPTSVTDNADAGGLWLDGENSYVIDGPFFTELAEIYGDELWDNIYNDDGSINVIDNAEDFQVAARPDITEEFYYHCVDGDVSWLDSGEQPEHAIEMPVTPVLGTEPPVQFATGAHSTLGVTLNGAMLSGSADMTAILASYTIAAFDDCGGHINPALGYHVHGTAGCSDVGEAPEGETPPFAYAIDGFTIHAPYGEGTDVELDACNGHTSEEYGYHYHAASLEENATLTCLMGVTAEGQDAGGGAPPRPGGGRP